MISLRDVVLFGAGGGGDRGNHARHRTDAQSYLRVMPRLINMYWSVQTQQIRLGSSKNQFLAYA